MATTKPLFDNDPRDMEQKLLALFQQQPYENLDDYVGFLYDALIAMAFRIRKLEDDKK